MKLSEYIKQSSLTNKAAEENLAALIGCSAVAVKFWANGKRTPRKEWWSKIKAATNGHVTISDFDV